MAREQWWTEGKRYMNERTAKLGHTLAWKRLPRPAGTLLVFEGTCTDCGATVTIDRTSSSAGSSPRCARDVECTGPGTAVLTEIEQKHASEEFNGIAATFVEALATAGITFERPKVPFRSPFAPEGQCGLVSKDGYTCIRSLNKRGTHNGNEWGGPHGHVGTHPDDDHTRPFTEDDVLYA